MGNETVANISRWLRSIGVMLLLTGCVSKPDARKLIAKQAEATQHLADAKTQFAAAKTKLREVAVTHKKTVEYHAVATKWVTLIVPAVDSLLLRVPEEYKVEVETLKVQVDELRNAIASATAPIVGTTAGLAEAEANVSSGEMKLLLVTAAMDDINVHVIPKLLVEIDDITNNRDDLVARLNKVLALSGLLLAGFAAVAATRFVKATIPATWGIPVGVFAIVYGFTFFVGRWGHIFQ